MAAPGTPWFKVFSQTRGHPKIEDLAEELDIPIPHAVGYLTCLWCWVVDFVPDGNMEEFSDAKIERGARWDGERGAFVAAMHSQKLLDPGNQIHNWELYSESYNRAKKQKEKRARAKSTDTVPHEYRTSTDTVPVEYTDSTSGVPGRGEQRKRDESRAEEKRRIEPVALTRKPAGSSKDIAAVFTRWKAYHPEEFLTPHPGLREWIEIDRRLTTDGIDLQTIIDAIDGIQHDPWPGRANHLTLIAAVKGSTEVYRFAKMRDGAVSEEETDPMLRAAMRHSAEFQARQAEEQNAGYQIQLGGPQGPGEDELT